MQIALGEGDLDAGLPKRAVDFHVELVSRREQLRDVSHEDAELERQGAVPEAQEENLRTRIA